MTEQQQACAELARAMYPTAVIEPSSSGDGIDIRVYDKPNETRSWYGFNPFNSPAASRELVLWLAKQEVIIKRRFIANLHPGLSDACVFNNAPIDEDMILEAMAAEPSVIARAACKSLGIKVSE